MKHWCLFFLMLPMITMGQRMGNIIIDRRALPPLPAIDHTVESSLKALPGYHKLNKEQGEWFYWTNYSRKNPRRFWDSVVTPILAVYPQFKNEFSASLKKDLYTSASLPQLVPSNQLEDVAQEHAEALASKSALPSHTSPNGHTFQARMEKANIKKCAGENISFGPANTVFALVLLYLDQGVPDLGHRKSLLNPNFTEMGIGISSYPENRRMVVQDFSCNQSL